MKEEKIVALYDTDKRVSKLYKKISNAVDKHGGGLSYAQIIGVLEIVKLETYNVEEE